MKTDIEIAQEAKMLPIGQVAAKLFVSEEDLEYYGKYKAKFADSLYGKLLDKPDGKLVLMTAVNPTPAGEGKTTTTVGLGQAKAWEKRGDRAARAFSWAVFWHKGRRCGRGVCAGGAYGGFKPAFYRGFSRHYLGEQFACSDVRQSYAAGQRAEN